MIRWGMTVEMLDLLTRMPVSGQSCVCHEPRVFGHQIGCLPGRSSQGTGKGGRRRVPRPLAASPNTYGPGQTL